MYTAHFNSISNSIINELGCINCNFGMTRFGKVFYEPNLKKK